MKYTEHDRQHRLEEMCRLANSRGGACLSKQFVDHKTKLHWRCAEGHEWSAIPQNVMRNHWCMICGNERQGRLKAHTIEMMRKVAAEKQGECLSQSYKNNLTKLRWRCKYGHEWEAVASNILSYGKDKGSWCPICAGRLSKPDQLRHLAELAQSRGGQVLSKRYVDAKTPLRWQCSKGHTWKAAPDTVKHGTWCPACVIMRRADRLPGRSLAFALTPPKAREAALERLRDFAKAFGGTCLAKRYTNIETPVRWRCTEGHEWDAIPYTVQKGHWCPVCSAGVSERICRALLEHITEERFPKHRPAWLKLRGGRGMELDGYSESLRLAFEYQGAQHYKFIPHFHGTESNFSYRKKMDALKRRLCQENNVLLMEIPGGVHHLKLQPYLTQKITEVTGRPELIRNRQVAKIADLNVWSLKQIEEMKQLASLRGGLCLSDFYVNNNTRLRWRCSEGHEWEAVPGSLKMGTWCPKCGDATAAKKRSRSIGDMRQYAASRGGECLSLDYQNSKSRLRWRCAKGHEWVAQANHVVAGNWCPKCGKEKLARLFALSIEDMRAAAAKRGGKCLSKNYENQRSRLRWRCARGHEWEAVAMSIRRGSWCPHCARQREAQEATGYSS
jgi:hypothetical protein